MYDAVDGVEAVSEDLPSHLGEAALLCLNDALVRGNDRAAALDLLAADALLTYGCEAATEQDLAADDEDVRALENFAQAYGAAGLSRLLQSAG
jgi:hypothetical protein